MALSHNTLTHSFTLVLF